MSTKNKIYFVSGIDTDCGKTIVTGAIARYLHQAGRAVITQKLIQTGCEGLSEDILKHRQIMGIDLFPEDRDGTTCPYVLKHPASPHLAAELDQLDISLEKIGQATATLGSRYETVLLEGAGGLFVPIFRGHYIIDYIRDNSLPLLLVTSAKVGSINHTLLSLKMCEHYGIKIHALIYNHFPCEDPLVINDSREIFKTYLSENHPDTNFYEMEDIETGSSISFEGI